MLDFEFIWSVREHARAQHIILSERLSTEGKSLIVLVPMLALLAGIVVLAVQAMTGDPDLFQSLWPVALILAIAAGALFWGRGWLDALHQRRSDSSLQYPIHHLLSEHGLRVRGRSAEVTIGWRSMRTVIETPDFVLFYFSEKAAYYLPKRVATVEQLDELRTLIRAHARKPRLSR